MIKFKKMKHKDHVISKENKEIIQQGTPLNAELLNRYEDVIEKLVNKVNELEDKVNELEKLR